MDMLPVDPIEPPQARLDEPLRRSLGRWAIGGAGAEAVMESAIRSVAEAHSSGSRKLLSCLFLTDPRFSKSWSTFSGLARQRSSITFHCLGKWRLSTWLKIGSSLLAADGGSVAALTSDNLRSILRRIATSSGDRARLVEEGVFLDEQLMPVPVLSAADVTLGSTAILREPPTAGVNRTEATRWVDLENSSDRDVATDVTLVYKDVLHPGEAVRIPLTSQLQPKELLGLNLLPVFRAFVEFHIEYIYNRTQMVSPVYTADAGHYFRWIALAFNPSSGGFGYMYRESEIR